MTHHANVLLGIIITLWLAIGVLVGAWLATRDEVIDLRGRLGPPLDAAGAPEGPAADRDLEGDPDATTVRNIG